jgi:galactose-1-phosphate uridylyltransferase
MNEFRLDPDTMTFTIVTDAKEECKACVDNGEEIASIPFDRGFTKVYEIKRDVQPSKYELTGSLFKSSVAHGYEEIIIENKEHENRIRKYTNEEIEQLLSIVAERVAEIEKYGLGGNIVITRKTDGHGFFDVFILPIPKNERKSCMECEAIQNIGDREVCKTENFVVYTPFAPKYDFELVISPRTHRQFKDCDNTVLFDLAAVVKKTLESQKVDLTMAIIQGQDGHFKMSVVGGSRNAFELLGVSRVRINPSVLAKEFRDAKVYER